MDWKQKIKEWYRHQLLSAAQKQAIEAYETKQQRSFWSVRILWLGVFILCLGLMVLGVDYGHVMPIWGKVLGIGTLILIGLLSIVYAYHRKKKLFLESALFFTFLMIGGGMGLIAQIFNIPIGSPLGLLLWAVVSVSIVLFSEKELLSLLWLPLFLGGVLGYWHLELLLLFFADEPIVSICVAEGMLLSMIWISGIANHPFIRAINKWGIVLFYSILLIGEYGISDPVVAFLMTIGFLGLLSWYAIHFQRIQLFNLTVFLIALRFVLLCLEMWRLSVGAGWRLVLVGSGVLACVGIYQYLINQRANKP